MILSAAVIVSFRAGFFNVGGEGQLYVGALAGALSASLGRYEDAERHFAEGMEIGESSGCFRQPRMRWP